MNKQVLVPIYSIDPNPYQPASAKNDEKVLEIAESIEQNLADGIGTKGLNQVPTARKIGNKYQLAFGHHRHQAFVLLFTQNKQDYAEMPLILEDLTDQQMFEAMATENLQRREISFIEEAEMYHTYMTTFNKNSVETAARFQKTDEYIRSRIMLLQLPDTAKEQVKQGKVNISFARELVTAKKVIGEAGIDEIMKRMDEPDFNEIYENPREAIEDAIRESPDLQPMAYRLPWLDVKKFPVKHLPPLSNKLLAELLDVENGDLARKELLKQLINFLGEGKEILDNDFSSFLPAQLEKVRILVNPPACTACPLHATFDGDHYCGLKACYERKEKAWAQAELEKVWKAIGIPLYVNEATDGRAVELNRWDQADCKLFADRHADLRLKQTTRSVWNNFEGLPSNAVLVAVGKTADKKLKSNGKVVEKAQAEIVDRELQSKMRSLRDEHVSRFLWSVAVPAFEGLLEALSNLPFSLFFYNNVMFDAVDFLPGMDSKEEQIDQIQKSKKKTDALKQLRRLMIAEILDRAMEWDSYNQFNGAKKPIIEFSKRAQKYAQEWSWKLPKDFVAQAEKYQVELDQALKELTKKAKVQ